MYDIYIYIYKGNKLHSMLKIKILIQYNIHMLGSDCWKELPSLTNDLVRKRRHPSVPIISLLLLPDTTPFCPYHLSTATTRYHTLLSLSSLYCYYQIPHPSVPIISLLLLPDTTTVLSTRRAFTLLPPEACKIVSPAPWVLPRELYNT